MAKEKNYKAIIERIVDRYQDELSTWELEFISSVYQWHILDNKFLSDKQKDTILKINGKMLGRS